MNGEIDVNRNCFEDYHSYLFSILLYFVAVFTVMLLLSRVVVRWIFFYFFAKGVPEGGIVILDCLFLTLRFWNRKCYYFKF